MTSRDALEILRSDAWKIRRYRCFAEE